MKLSEGLRAIEAESFRGCIKLEEICVPGSVERIEARAFLNCMALEKTVFSNGLKRIGEQAFAESAAVTVMLPETVEVIAAYAFEKCYWLSTVILPDRRLFVGKGVFAGCEGLEVLVIAKGRRVFARQRERWGLSDQTQILSHPELQAAELFAEYTDLTVSQERRDQLREELQGYLFAKKHKRKKKKKAE